MIKRTIKYKNLFTEADEEKEFYFNLTKGEIIEMNLEYADGEENGLEKKLTEALQKKDMKFIIAFFRDTLQRSYGVRVGDRFEKKSEYWEDFVGSDAFSELFLNLVSDAEFANEFIKGIFPKDLLVQINEAQAQRTQTVELPAWKRDDRDPTPQELQAMSPQEIQEAFAARMTKGQGDRS